MQPTIKELEAQAHASATAAKILCEAMERALVVLKEAGVTTGSSGADASPQEPEAALFADRVAAAREYRRAAADQRPKVQ